MQRVQDSGGAVGEVEPAAAELFDVAGEQPVVPVGCRTGQDRPGQPVAVRRSDSDGEFGRLVLGRPTVLGGRAPAGDLRDGGVEEWSRHREPGGDHVREVCGLGRRQPDQLGQWQEQCQPQAGQGVVVDSGAGAVPGGGEALVAQPGPAMPVDRCGDLEVDERDPVVRADHDVEQVQVAVDEAALVDGPDDLFDLPVDVQRPPRVGGPVGVGGVGVDERVPVDQDLVQRPALDELQRQEPVLAEGELVVHAGHLRQVGESTQRLGLTGQTGPRVGAVGVQAGVRSRLLEHHLGVGAQVPADVEAAAVGEVDDLLDPVRHLVGAGGVARRQVRFEEIGQAHPGRYVEDRVASVGHQGAAVVLDRRDDLAVRGMAVAGGEAAVAHVHRAGAVAQVAEDVRAGFAGEQLVEFLADQFQLRVVTGIDGDELAAGRPGGVLGVAQQQGAGTAEELEGQTARDAVVPDGVQHPLGVVQGRRHVDLPALLRQRTAVRGVDQPVVERLGTPAVGQGPPGRREGGLFGGAAERVVEVPVGGAVAVVPVVHRDHSLP